MFDTGKVFKSVKVSKIKYSNPKDKPTITANWIHGQFGEVFSIPISATISETISSFDLIKMAKEFEEPFRGQFSRLNIKLKNDFKLDSSFVTFQIEIK